MDDDCSKVWVPASAGRPDQYGEPLGNDGRGWTLILTDDPDGAIRVGGFLASEDPEQYIVR